MSNPVVAEALRGGRVEFGASRVGRGRRRGRRDRDGVRRHRAAGLSALRGQGAAGAAADRERRRGPAGLEPKGDRARLRLPFRRARACRDGARDAGEGRARRKRARMRRPLAAQRAGLPRDGAFGGDAERAAQQLFGQACGLRLPRLRGRDRPEVLCRAGSRGAARGRLRRRRGDRGCSSARRRGASTAARSRPTPFPCGRWRWASPGSGRGRGSSGSARAQPRGSAPRSRPIRRSSPGRDGSTPRS